MLDKGVDRRGPPKPAGKFATILIGLVQLVVPVSALLGSIALVWLVRSEPAHELSFLGQIDPALSPTHPEWPIWGGMGELTLGLLVLPIIFLVVNLINRRYGPGFTLWAVTLAWAILAGGIYGALNQGLLSSFETEIAPMPFAVAFGVSIFAGQVLAIYFFDWLRGIPWWEAPLIGALIGGVAQTLLFPALGMLQATGSIEGAFSGDALPRLLALCGLQLVWAVGQLLPTAMLRRVIRPLSGYGGA